MNTEVLPRLMVEGDGRGRIVDLRALAKDWAQWPDEREEMIAQAPQRVRWYHRFTKRRRDLPRIAVVVHALCDRDDVTVPDWVWQHRSPKLIPLTDSVPANGKYAKMVQAKAPEACAYHRVWFTQADIEDHRVHGLTSVWDDIDDGVVDATDR